MAEVLLLTETISTVARRIQEQTENKERLQYEGNFNQGEIDGAGHMIYKDQSKYLGKWVDGKREGPSEFFEKMEVISNTRETIQMDPLRRQPLV